MPPEPLSFYKKRVSKRLQALYSQKVAPSTLDGKVLPDTTLDQADTKRLKSSHEVTKVPKTGGASNTTTTVETDNTLSNVGEPKRRKLRHDTDEVSLVEVVETSKKTKASTGTALACSSSKHNTSSETTIVGSTENLKEVTSTTSSLTNTKRITTRSEVTIEYQARYSRHPSESSNISVVDSLPSLAFTSTTDSTLSTPSYYSKPGDSLKHADNSLPAKSTNQVNNHKETIQKHSPILINLVSEDSDSDIQEVDQVETPLKEEICTPVDQIRNKGYWNVRPDWVLPQELRVNKEAQFWEDVYFEPEELPSESQPGSSQNHHGGIPGVNLTKDFSLEPVIDHEYISNIIENLRDKELEFTCNRDYMSSQDELDWGVRAKLATWMQLFVSRLNLSPSIAFNSVNIFDRFLSLRKASAARVPIIALVCVSIASKFELQTHPSIGQLLKYSGLATDAKDIMRSEEYILRVLDFKVDFPNPLEFLDLAILSENSHPQVRLMSTFFLEICVNTRLAVLFLPSMMASSAFSIARLVLRRGSWTDEHKKYTGYSKDCLRLCCTQMIDQIHSFLVSQSNRQKICSAKYIDVAKLTLQWIELRYKMFNANQLSSRKQQR